MKPKGNNNQLSSQDVFVKQSSLVDNNCGAGSNCSVVATNTLGDIVDEGSRSDVSVAATGDGSCGGTTKLYHYK